MERMPSMVDMSLSASENPTNSPISPYPDDKPRYPYGLCIRLTHDELQKLNVDYSDWSVGDHFHLQALAKITSISQNETEGGEHCCVEMQIIALAGENEEEEVEDGDDDPEY